MPLIRPSLRRRRVRAVPIEVTFTVEYPPWARVVDVPIDAGWNWPPITRVPVSPFEFAARDRHLRRDLALS